MNFLPGSIISNTVVKLGLIGGGLFLLWRWFNNRGDENRASRSDKDITTNPGVGQAQLLRIAMNPSGSALLFDTDGTNKDAILKLATQIKDLDAVVEAYKARYKGSLLKHLEVELGTSDYARFLALAGGGNNTGYNYEVVKQGVEKGQWMRATKTAYIRSSPKKDNGIFTTEDLLLKALNPLNVFDKSKRIGNILTQAKQGEMVGWTTGKTGYDEIHDIIFLEGQTLNKKKQRVSFWVAKSQVEFISKEEVQKRKDKGEKFKLTELAGLPLIRLYAKAATEVLNESFEKVKTASPGTYLGTPTLELFLMGSRFIQFVNDQGVVYWTLTEKTQLKRSSDEL